MEFAIANSASIGSILAEMALAAGEGADETEGLMLPGDLVDGEMPETLENQGALKSEGKQYTFVKEEGSHLLSKCADMIAEQNRFSETKPIDLKSGNNPLSFKEKTLKEKEFKVLDPLSLNLKGKESQEGGKTKSYMKADTAAHRSLEKGSTPKSAAQLKDTPALKLQQNHAKNLEQKIQREFEKDRSSAPRQNEAQTGRQQVRENEQREGIPGYLKREKNEERENQQQRQQREDEEEGFAGGGQSKKEDHESSDQESSEGRVTKSERSFAKEFADYANEDSILSQILNMRVSQFDVLILFIEIMKLEIRGREQERIARRQERELQLMHMQNIVENYKNQGSWGIYNGCSAGLFAIVSGLCPIVGHVKGDWIIQKLGSVFSQFKDMKSSTLFKGLEKMTSAMSDMSKSSGQIHNAFADSNKTYDEHMSSIHRTDWDENTRTMDEIKDSWKGIENFLYQALQMYHDAIRQLYNA